MKIITYYAMPISPWTYLGHQRFCDMAAKAVAQVDLKMMDLGQVFAISGGLPLAQRAPQRQAYRLQELARWRDASGLPLNIHPKFFPANGTLASLIVLHLRDTVSTAAALAFLGAVLKAVWADELNIADEAVLAQLLAKQGFPASLLIAAQGEATQASYALDTQCAKGAGVFGAPTFIIGEQMFWGQDRLDFVEKALMNNKDNS